MAVKGLRGRYEVEGKVNDQEGKATYAVRRAPAMDEHRVIPAHSRVTNDHADIAFGFFGGLLGSFGDGGSDCFG
jgi:hypothetical protein